MVDIVNALVCLVMMILLAPIAVAMRSDGHWPQRIAFIIVALLLALQVLGPVFDDWLPDANGLQAVFNTVMLAVVLSARREIMAIVKLTVGKPPQDTGARRRAADMPPELFRQVHGRGNP